MQKYSLKKGRSVTIVTDQLLFTVHRSQFVFPVISIII
ncbi:hypothetical protein C900_04311 [Fulvivirga imtechensis AK7]|uniref:Uncharacterized protein n=1 Tax=Fulvivirga imtechensis AK7 TaxID=1237149 RepID=L8K0K1_9BACT|nr:hypothetical protein C900_04311 [Fulvivirga imtechensis AK7]